MCARASLRVYECDSAARHPRTTGKEVWSGGANTLARKIDREKTKTKRQNDGEKLIIRGKNKTRERMGKGNFQSGEMWSCQLENGDDEASKMWDPRDRFAPRETVIPFAPKIKITKRSHRIASRH